MNQGSGTEGAEVPKRSKVDAVHAVAKAAIGSVPGIGAAGAELFAYVVQAPYEKRREEWMEQVGEVLAELRNRRGVDLEALRDDPEFTDTVLTATQAALRTRSAKKKEALRNVIANSAMQSAPDEADRIMFIRLVDELSEWHLALLELFRDPAAFLSEKGEDLSRASIGSLSSVIEAAYPKLRGRRDLYDHWWRELHTRGLVTTDGLHTMMTAHGAMAARLTPFGHQFIEFVTAA